MTLETLHHTEQASLLTVEIAFGTLFHVRKRGIITSRTDLIFDVGEGNQFGTMQVRQNERGLTIVGFPGTASPENFGQLLGRVSLEEVLSAMRQRAKNLKYELTDKELATLLEYSKKLPRILSLQDSQLF